MLRKVRIILKTQRLILRGLVKTDAPFILELLNTTEYIQFIGDKNVRNIKDAEEHIKTRLDSYKNKNIGRWLVELKETNIPIGICGLFERDYSEELDIGFALLSKYVGQGFGYEAAKATLDYGFNKLHLKRIDAYVKKENMGSVGLLKKLGLQYKKKVEPTKGDKVCLFSVIKKPE